MRTTPTTATVERLAAQGHLIGDRWESSDAAGSYDHRYAATGQVQARVGLAGGVEVAAAVAAARAAQPGWSNLAPVKRAKVLYRLADLLEHHREEAAELGALDNGTPVSVMNPGAYAAAWVRYYAGWCDKLDGEMLSAEPGLSFVRLDPYGVIAVIPPWNGSMMGMGQKCGPALAAGNAVVAKPPEVSPFGMLRFAELALEAGLPAGVLNVVVGGAEAGAALAGHPDVDKISFTGGGATARSLMQTAAGNLTPLALELGGKSPNIVFPDADLSTAATSACFGTAVLAGQGCALPTRLYVHDDVYDEVVERLVAALGSLAVGDPLDPATFVGPVVTEAAMERILATVDRARARRGPAAGRGPPADRRAWPQGGSWPPRCSGRSTTRATWPATKCSARCRPSCGSAPRTRSWRWPTTRRFGLGAYLHTRDLGRIQRFARDLQSGTVAVNGMGRISPATPFGGYKQSGFGREGGRAGIEEMVRRKTVFVAP